MNWQILDSLNQIQTINEMSESRTQIIFKHSTRCSISTMAEGRLNRAEAPSNADFYYLDLLQHRDISNEIASVYKIQHESPQILVIKNKDCVLEQTHSGINMKEISEYI
jgi:bacillithiol system protein YtxJ